MAKTHSWVPYEINSSTSKKNFNLEQDIDQGGGKVID